MINPLPEPVPGPRWTRKRFNTMLADCYGTNAAGDINVDAVAEYAGVTTTTVHRWIGSDNAPNSRHTAAPPARITQLQRGPDNVESLNTGAFERAQLILANLDDDTYILPTWRESGWLNEHAVIIVEVNNKPWRQVVVTKANTRALTEIRRRSVIVTGLALPTRFHAQVLAHAVMLRQQEWRVHPSAEQLAKGRTQVWMADAPAVPLGSLADQIGVGPGRQVDDRDQDRRSADRSPRSGRNG